MGQRNPNKISWLTKKKVAKRSTLNPMSKSKIEQTNGEYETRVKLCLRCGGTPITSKRTIKLNNREKYELKSVICKGGTCEICGKPAYDWQPLHPHEKIHRGQGGKLTLENSVMCHDYPCHAQAQNNEVKWRR